MNQIKFLFSVIILLMFVLSGCKENDAVVNNDNNNDTTAVITKSPKRGLAYNMTDAKDFAALSGSVSWWYNWGKSTDAPADYYSTYKMEFIPMLWGGNTSANDMLTVKYFIENHPEVKYLLAMNEPNLTDQAK